MRILLTGGTGFVGCAVARAARKRGDQVVVVSRQTRAGDGGDVVGWEALEREVGLADAVVHLAGEPVAEERWTPQRLERIRASRVETTARIALAVERAQRKPRVLLSASAVGIYGTRLDDEIQDEHAPPGADALARICVAWEAAAAPARAAGVRVVHPRFGVVLGRGGGALARMEGAFKWFAGGAVGSGKQWLSWVHWSDVVRALLFAIDEDALAGAVNVVAPHPVTMHELARALGRAMGRPAVLGVPAFALRLALGEGLAQMLLTGQRATPAALRRTGFVFDFTSVDEALADLFSRPG